MMLLCLLLLALTCHATYRPLSLFSRRSLLHMRIDTTFLQSSSQDTYINAILRNSVEGCKKALQKQEKRMEIDFIANRKNDLSVTETLDTTRKFTREFIKPLITTYGSDLWILFPERSEQQLALQAWGMSADNAPCTVTCIKDALAYLSKEAGAAKVTPPKLMIAVNPGFNIDEYINLAAIGDKAVDCPLIIINGQLDRIRNGYYPSLFYPGLSKTIPFYGTFNYIFWLTNLSFDGNRFAGWIAKACGTDYEIFVRNKSLSSQQGGSYDLVLELPGTEKMNYNQVYKSAKEEYKRRNGGMSFGTF